MVFDVAGPGKGVPVGVLGKQDVAQWISYDPEQVDDLQSVGSVAGFAPKYQP